MHVLDVYMYVPICVFVAFWWVGREISNCISACMYAHKDKELDKLSIVIRILFIVRHFSEPREGVCCLYPSLSSTGKSSEI